MEGQVKGSNYDSICNRVYYEYGNSIFSLRRFYIKMSIVEKTYKTTHCVYDIPWYVGIIIIVIFYILNKK